MFSVTLYIGDIGMPNKYDSKHAASNEYLLVLIYVTRFAKRVLFAQL